MYLEVHTVAKVQYLHKSTSRGPVFKTRILHLVY